MIVALIPMLLAFTWGGGTYAWNSLPIVGMLIFSFVMLLIFGIAETRAENPILPMSLFKNSIFSFSALEMFLFNGVMIAVTTFIPLFLQVVKGLSASSSGAIITPMMVSLMAGVMISGLLISKTCRYKLLSVAGFLIMDSGIAILLFLNRNTGNSIILIAMIIIGLGTGVVMAIYNVTAQNVFPNSQMGIVTSSIQFFRMMGQTIASSVLGTILSKSFNKGLQGLDVSKFSEKLARQLKNADMITDPNAVNSLRSQVPAGLLSGFEETMDQIKQILSNSVRQVFGICAVILLAALIVAFFMKEVPMSKKISVDNGEGRIS